MVRTRKAIYVGNQEIQIRYIGNKLIFENLGDMEDKIKVSGTEIFTDKADENSVVHVEMDGKSYQNAGSGKNLINQNKTRLPPIVSIEGIEYYKVFGVRDVATITFESFFKTNTQYTIQFLGLVTTYFNEVFVEYVGGGSDNKHFTHASLDSLTTRSGETVSRIIIDTGTAAAFGYIKVDTFQLEEGIVATSYEPPAPSPDYPIEIHSLNNVDVVSSTEKLSEGQLEEYNYDTEYANIHKINLSLSEPLRSVGDVKDRLFRDSDGLWKVERNVEVTGTEDGTQPITDVYSPYDVPVTEVLSGEYQNKLNNLRSFQDSNYIYTISSNDISPTLHATFKSKGWYDYYLKTLLK